MAQIARRRRDRTAWLADARPGCRAAFARNGLGVALLLVGGMIGLAWGCTSEHGLHPAPLPPVGGGGTSAGGSGGNGGHDVGGSRPERAARALIVDQELRHHSSWIDVIDAFEQAHLTTSYRRFYPHVTAGDVDLVAEEYPHEIIVVAAGRSPGNPSSLLRFADVEPLRRFVTQGGALVLVPQHGWQDSVSGENDFFVLNRVLEELAVPVRVDRNTIIGQVWTDAPHTPTEWGYPTPLEFQLGYPYVLTPEDQPLPAGSSPTLRVASDQVQVLLRTYDEGYLWKKLAGVGSVVSLHEERAVAALAQAGEGVVAVVPRGVLLLSAATGNLSDKPAMDPAAEQAGREWVQALVAQLRDLVHDDAPFEVTAVRDSDELFSVEAEGHPALAPDGDVYAIVAGVSDLPLPAVPPVGPLVEEVPTPPSVSRPEPAWFSTGGGRLAYGGLPPELSDMSAAFQEIVSHDVDVLMTSTGPSALISLSGSALDAEKAKYGDVAAMAVAADARWFVGGWFNHEAGEYPEMVGAHGYVANNPAPLHAAFWNEEIIPVYAAVGQLAADHPGLAGLHFDLELYSGPVFHHDGWAFSDDTLGVYLAVQTDPQLEIDLTQAGPGARLDLLVDRGVLGDYFGALEQAAFELGAACRQAAHQAAPGLELTIYAPGFPNTWFYQGLLRGLGTHEQPVVVLTYEGWGDRPTEALYAAGVEWAHLGGTIVSHWLPSDFGDVLGSLAGSTDGYWYFTFNDFSVTNPSPPALHGSGAEYWAAVDEANASL